MSFKEILIKIWEIPSVQVILDTILKLGLTALLSGFIGYEREHSHRPAGFRTHILVAVGSTLVMATSVHMFDMYQGLTNLDPGRLGAQVISGIGFLGAGTILREGFSVKGLTTAASLWAVSCIGLAVGIGFYEGALIATIVIYVTLNILKRVIIKGNAGKNLYIEVEDVTQIAPEIGSIIKKSGANLHSLEILYADGDDRRLGEKSTVVLKALIYSKHDAGLELIRDSISSLDGVKDLYID
ncbi:MAG TPA: MgtC/SapB family protein [Clostridia bacterium]|nr:MgtC/SapB family protein [Clostridia bacterium]